MKVRHIKSLDLWLLTKGNRVLYRGNASPWKSPNVIAAALRREVAAQGPHRNMRDGRSAA